MATGQNIESLVIPGNAQNVAERPYNKGIRGDVPPQLVEKGACLEAKNFTCVTGGLRRSPAISYFIDTPTTYPPWQDLVTFWKVDGTEELLGMDQKFLYLLTPPSTLTPYSWEFTPPGAQTLSLSTASTGVTASAAVNWDDVEEQIQQGDILMYGATYQYSSIIASVTDDDQLVLFDNALETNVAEAVWKIRRAFSASNPYIVDWTVITGGTPRVLFADGSRFLTSYNGTSYTTYLRTYTTGTISNTGTAVTGVGTAWLDEGFAAGDIMHIDTGGTSHEVTISAVNSNTSITIGSNPGDHAGVLYNIMEVPTLIPVCVVYFKNRVWIADIYESSKWHRQRIRWTELGDQDDFRLGGYLDLPYVQGAIKRLVPLGDFLVAFFDDAIYIGRATNLPALPLSFQKLETGGVGLLGPKAVCSWIDSLFFVGQDDIYQLSPSGLQGIGTPVVKRTVSEVASSRHWKICVATDLNHDRVLFGFPKDTDEIEEVWSYNYKTKAWAWEDINCYMLSGNIWAGVKTWENLVTVDWDTGTVATTISDKTLTVSTSWGTFPAVGDTVLIDLDADGNYEFETTVESYTSTLALEMVLPATATVGAAAYRIVHSAATWGGAEMQAYPTWQAIKGSSTTIKDVYVLKYDTVWKYTEDLTTNEGTAISVELITGDRDFDIPDEEKIFYRLAVKLETWTETDIVFAAYASNDRGQHWKSLGNLVIPAGKDEGKVDFRMRGSCVRFRLMSSSAVLPYTFNEITMDVRTLGREIAGRGDPV